jgi:hypothetical protein
VRYSIGLSGFDPVLEALDTLPRQAWKAAVDEHGNPRDAAQVAELTRHVRRTAKPWPDGMRVLARRERPHPGAQLRITDRDGWRITVFITNIPGGRLADHERRHRLRARAEDRIRCLKDTGLRNLPLHQFTANQIWLELVALANDLLAWTQHLAFAGTPARLWEPSSCACGCCTSQAASSAPPDGTYSDYPAAGPGPTPCSPATTASPHSLTDSTPQDPETAADAATSRAATTPTERHTRHTSPHKITKDRGWVAASVGEAVYPVTA